MEQESPDLDFFGNEKRQYGEFKKNHICCNDQFLDFTIKLTYSLSTGIGRNTMATCERCGLQKDITDYSVW